MLSASLIGDPFQVNTTPLPEIFFAYSPPSVAVSENGHSVVIWSSGERAGGEIGSETYGQLYNADGKPLGAEFSVRLGGTRPAVAMDSDGNFVVITESATSSERSLGHLFAADGTPLGTSFTVGSFEEYGHYSWNFDVAMGAEGDFVVAWEAWVDEGFSAPHVYAQRFSANGATKGEAIAISNSGTDPSIAMDADGDFVVIWHGNDDGGRILGQRYESDGTPDGEGIRITELGTSDLHSSVDMDAHGNFVVVWSRQEGWESSTHGRQYSADGTQGQEFRIDEGGYPIVTMGAMGDFHVAWGNFAPTVDGGTYSRWYAADGTPQEGTEFYLEGRWVYPGAVDCSGNTLLTSHTGPYLYIYGQRLDMGAPVTNSNDTGTVVTNTNDSGPGSLRAAIEAANTRVGPDTIVFAIPETDPNFIDIDSSEPGGDDEAGVFIIRPLSPLPPLDDPTGGTTIASCHARNRNVFGPDIVISGALAGAGANGFELASSNNKISGVTIQNFGGSGIVVSGGTGNVVTGNYIGTDAIGRSAASNGGDGILVTSAATNTQIGVVKAGVAGTPNVIATNFGHGINIAGASATKVSGNFIGTTSDGILELGNGGSGVLVADGATDVFIGSDLTFVDSEKSNTIAYNAGPGVSVAGETSRAIIRGNSIRDNRGLGIDLVDAQHGPGQITPNDTGDGDDGPNGLQNFPVITGIKNGAKTEVAFRLQSSPNTFFDVDFYATSVGEAGTEHEVIQGSRYLGTLFIETDARGDFSTHSGDTRHTVIDARTIQGEFVTATATSRTAGSRGTSEFMPFPLVVNIATHGFNPTPPWLPAIGAPWEHFWEGWHELGSVLDSVPEEGTFLADRVVTYVSEWESSEGFLAAFTQLFVALVADASAELASLDGNPELAAQRKELSDHFRLGASRNAFKSGGNAHRAADAVANEVRSLLLPPAQSLQFQRLHLIGHSRGAAVNSGVSNILFKEGYGVDQYTSLDGFSTDWSPGGLIGDISIQQDTRANRLVSYRVEKDIANFAVDGVENALADTSLSDMILKVTEFLGPDNPLNELLLDARIRDRLRLLDVRAPERPGFNDDVYFSGDPPGFANTVIAGDSNHVNVTEKYLRSGSAQQINEQYILHNFVGLNRQGALGPPPNDNPLADAWGTADSHGIPDDSGVQFAGRFSEYSAEQRSAFREFRSGSFEDLGAYVTKGQSFAADPTGIEIVDRWIQISADPQAVLNSVWDVAGTATLVNENGNWVAELTQTDDTSISQWLDFGIRDPLWLEFDVEVVQSGGDDVVEVLFDDRVLASYGLAALESPARLRVDLSEMIEQEGDFRFRIAGSAETAAIVRLDNVSVQVAGSRAQNPMIAADVDNNGFVTARDALLVINQLGRSLPPGQSSIPVTIDIAVPPYYDVNGDGQISSLDALLVINELARQSTNSIQGESEGDAVTLPSAEHRSQKPTIGSVREELTNSLLKPALQKLVLRPHLRDSDAGFLSGDVIDRIALDREKSDSKKDNLAAVDEALALFFEREIATLHSRLV